MHSHTTISSRIHPSRKTAFTEGIRIADHPVQKLDELMPWNWKARDIAISRAA
jgi:hypothetical protein